MFAVYGANQNEKITKNPKLKKTALAFAGTAIGWDKCAQRLNSKSSCPNECKALLIFSLASFLGLDTPLA